MHRFISWTTVVLLLWEPCAHATTWYTIGIGSISSCGTFVKAEEAMTPGPEGKTQTMTWGGKTWVEMGEAYEEWLMGFVSAANLSRLDGTKQSMVDRDGIVLWVKRYCEAHPDESMVDAAGAFIARQQKKAK
jgi:hypothetical protein